MGHDPRAIANLMLDIADELSLSLTHMALHKTLYYAHGWFLAAYGSPLVREDFEAWEHGPVLPTVYAAFKRAGRQAISFRADRFDPVTQVRHTAAAKVGDDVRSFVQNIVRAYGRLDALTLSDMTHRKGGPWDQVWNAGSGQITLGMRIKNETIKADFITQASHKVAG